MTPELEQYRLECRAWLSEHAPRFGKREGLDFDQEIALAREWQALKASAGYAAITLPEQYGGAGKSELH